MEGARLDIIDFSIENNSIFNTTEFIEGITQAIMNKLDNHIAELSASENQGKEECGLKEFDNTQVEENIEQVTEIMETTEEETPEVVDDLKKDEETEDSEITEDEENSENEENDEEQNDSVNENMEEENETVNDVSDQEEHSIEYSVSYNGEIKTFSSSLIEKLNALYELVNNTYGESDNAWYDVDAYDDEKIVLMHDYWGGKHYRQSYTVKKDVYSLKGDRTEVFCNYLSKDEQAQLESMKANYSSISEKLEKYESEPEKMEILNSTDYANIANQKDFEELKKQENHFDLTVDEVKDKADAMLLQFAKSGKLNFAAVEKEKEEPKKDFFAFARVEQNNSFLDGLLKRK